METKENASLVLRTYDILQNSTVSLTDNTVGTISTSGQVITWKNINMRLVLGDLYDNFTKFNIRLSAHALRMCAVSLTDYTVSFWMSGLNFTNQCYNVKTGTMGNSACVGVANINATTTVGAVTEIMNNVATFRPSEMATITIELKNSSNTVVNGYDEKINLWVNHQTFIFDIVGCDGYETEDYKRRFKNDNAMSYDENKRFKEPFYLK